MNLNLNLIGLLTFLVDDAATNPYDKNNSETTSLDIAVKNHNTQNFCTIWN